MRRHRSELAAGDVVLARPDELHRLAGCFRQEHRIEHHLLRAATAVAAAQEMLVQCDFATVDVEEAGDLRVQARRPLGAGPDLHRLAVGRNRGGGVQGLHLSVIDVAGAVIAAEHLGRFAHGPARVAGAPERHAFLAEVAADRRQFIEPALAVVMRTGRVAPGDLEQVLRRLGRLDTRADDADTFRQFHDVGHARDLAGTRVIDRDRRAAGVGRLQDRGIDHAVDLRVHGVFGSTHDLERHVDAGHVLADEPELRCRLEVLVLDLRQFGRRLREPRDLAIRDAAAGCGVNDDAGLGRKLGRGHVPFRGHSIDQDAASLGAGDPHRFEIAADGGARGGLEDAVVPRIAEFLLVPFRRRDRANLRPVGVEFVGENGRQRRERALAHFGRGRHDGDGAVGRDRNPHIGRGRCVGARVACQPADQRQRIGRDGQRKGKPGGSPE